MFIYSLCFTGQAEAIANEIHEAGVFKTFNIKIFCLKEENKKFNIADVKCAIFVCSTTGNQFTLIFLDLYRPK